MNSARPVHARERNAAADPLGGDQQIGLDAFVCSPAHISAGPAEPGLHLVVDDTMPCERPSSWRRRR